MPLLHDSVETKKMDTRMIERNVARGVVTAAEVEQHVRSLPDDAENAEYVSIQSLMSDQVDADSRSETTHH